MLIGKGVKCRFPYSIVSYLYIYIYISCSGFIYLSFTCNFVLGGVSSSSWCLGKTALFYFGTPLAFHMIILS